MTIMLAGDESDRNGRPGRTLAKSSYNADGHMDMYQAMRVFYESGYEGTMTLDHSPRFAPGYEGAETAYAIGYMRALMQRAEAELGRA